MKIKSISLFNIGPFINLNTFDFSFSKEKNIVLIGGKNGAGKTTFFKAIKTCLYGCKIWGFDAPGKEYYSIINGLINTKSMYNSNINAYIEVQLFFNDGKETNIYTLHREWKKVRTSLTEYSHIKKNGNVIIGQEEDDFSNYLLSVIPPDMFNFYFFDGEAIADFFLGSEGNKNFRNAFLKLFGLDTLSIMVENFNRNIKKSTIKESDYSNYLNARKAYECELTKCNTLEHDITDIENQIDQCQIKIRSLQLGYSKSGGIGLSEWKDLNSNLIKEESYRDSINRWLKEVANNYIPFLILEKNLIKLLHEFELVQQQQKSKLIIDTFASAQFMERLDNYLRAKGDDAIDSQDIMNFLRDELIYSSNSIIFDFSLSQLTRISSQINEKLLFDGNRVIVELENLESSIRRSKKNRDLLSTSSIDGYEEYVEEKERIERVISDLISLLEKKRLEYDNEKIVLEESLKAYEKAKALYENVLKNKSVSDIAERAAATFSLVEDRLVKRQSKLLQEEFIACFNSIINKDNFVDGIVIDGKINVIPYKYIEISRNQLAYYQDVNREFLTLLGSSQAQVILDMNRLEFCEIEFARLPAPIKAPFSQGERQVYIMSIYLALLKTSHKDVPFFIDTPFARIDSKHRTSIVSEFFTKIKNQMFILSTDEEIVGEYKEMLEQKISDIYTLQISEYGVSKIKRDRYFEE